MQGFLSHYTPSLMNPEDLEAVFVQRQPLLTDLLENIENSILTEAKHHTLLIGPRGIGKTHLISMIYHRVSANEVFKDKLKIAWLREEEWGVATFLDLLVRILNSLIEEYKDPNLEEQVKGLYSVSTEQAEQLAGHILRQYCQDQTLLLLMENLDEIFKGLEESGQQAFRAYLQNYGFITIVATSQSLFSGVKSRDLPFYGFFSITHLKPLSLEEAITLLANIAKWRGDQDLADLLITPLGKSRIRAIHHLAGGNHRIYIIFSQFLTTASLDSLVEPFMKTLDDLTPFYQSRMQFISPQQRKIIEYLCEQRGAIPVKEIAQYCFISSQTASSQLKQLREMGYVYADAQGRESFYELQEPLMRICLEAKKRRGTPNQLFISFLRVWFSREELEKRLEILPLEAVFDRECTRLALDEMEVSDDPAIAALLRDWNHAWQDSNYKKMLEVSKELTSIRNSSLDWIRVAQANLGLGNKNDVTKALNNAVNIEPENDKIWGAKGRINEILGEFNQSLEDYNEALKLNRNNAEIWSGKAITEGLLFSEGASHLKEQVLASIKNALKLTKENSYVLNCCSYAYEIIEETDLALECVNKAIEINDEDDWAWERKSSILKFANKDEALNSALKAVELNRYSFFNQNLNKLAEIYYYCQDYKKALDTINICINLCEYNGFTWLLKGNILLASNSSLFYEIMSCYDKFLSLDINSPQKLRESAKNSLKSLSKNIFLNVIKKSQESKTWLNDINSILAIYKKYNLLGELGSSLVESIKVINEPSTSEHTAQAWLEMWQDLAGHYPEFQVALNLLRVAVEYKIQKDKRVLFQLPKEERQILEELLNPV